MSSNIIIGTAGHIDHGKTSLIRKLTGIETDRWKEEKKRGITIDLGFAYFDLPSGRRAGIIDVPGHEKFIKNMLAGASGVDVVLLIIAADEGIMPQTKEHLDILSMLDVKNGIIVLTKSDLVEEEWLMLVEEEVREGVKGSVVENAKIIPVSSMTGAGFDELTAEIDRLVETVEPKKTYESTRFPIDRSFSVTGFGTIVTGTLSEGKINLGDTYEIYPKGIITKVRKIQVHGEDVETAYAGQRVAVNLTNVKKDDINRGDVLAPEGELTTAHMIDAKIKLLPGYARELENWTRLRFYQGTREALCRTLFSLEWKKK
jgi:selenocysteine-specific elongation factor